MYSFKEKQKHFSELQNSDAASLDLKLLTQKSPSHPLVKKFSRNPRRYANEILYQLLDVAERDEIRNNRRPPVSKSNEESEKIGNVTPESTDPEQQDKISDVTGQIEGAEERAEGVEERAEEAEERAEETEERAEEAEERAEEAEAALEQEKKKVATTSKPVSNPKEKSKSGKNTPKSTGTTSPTHKSRQPQSSTTTGS